MTLSFCLIQEILLYETAQSTIVQSLGAIIGVWAAHFMFAEDIFQISIKMRTGRSQGFSEVVATFGLLIVIFGGIQHKPDAVQVLVGLYGTAAYWFTASTNFANPAFTIARMLSDACTDIEPASTLLFIIMQIIGAAMAVAVAKFCFQILSNSTSNLTVAGSHPTR